MLLNRRTTSLLLPITCSLTTSALLGSACTRLDSPNDDSGNRKGAAGATAVAERTSFGTGAGGASATPYPSDAHGGSTLEPRSYSAGGRTALGSAGGNSELYPSGSTMGTAGTAADDIGLGCLDPTGLNGLGCYRCSPETITEFESACTTATCTPFDNKKRLARLGVDGILPGLPQSLAAYDDAGSAGASGSPLQAGAGAPTNGGTVGTSTFSCDELGASGKVIYVTGSSAAKPFLQQIAQQLSIRSVYLVYTPTGSCTGVDAALNRTRVKTVGSAAASSNSVYWDGISSTGLSCQLPSDGVSTDISISDVFAQTCPGFELSSLEAQQVRDAHGPIQTMAFVVPSTAKYSEISAQAAYFVFGFGANASVLDPAGTQPVWKDESFLLIRSATSGTQAMLAAVIGVPSARWRGKSHATSDEVSNALQVALGDSDTADKTLGILAVDYIDSRNLRPQIRILAFQDSNQPCAFYPDSTTTARDKRNVRDGHYPIWSPMHLLYRVDTSGSPENAANRQEVSDILGYLSGSKALPNGVRLLDVYAASGLIPECAMRVSRTMDGGNLIPFTPSNPCACAFEQAATGATSCTRCSVQGDCSAYQSCSLGFCEG